MYIVIGLEVFNYGKVMGIHSSKKIALEQAQILQATKNIHVCQNYKTLTETEIKKQKIVLY